MLLATRFASPEIVCAPVRYVPDAIVWFDVEGVIVAAPFVVMDAVNETELLPAVPDATYPAVTAGVTLTDLESVSVFVPVLTDAEVPVIEAGAVAEPASTDLVCCDE